MILPLFLKKNGNMRRNDEKKNNVFRMRKLKERLEKKLRESFKLKRNAVKS